MCSPFFTLLPTWPSRDTLFPYPAVKIEIDGASQITKKCRSSGVIFSTPTVTPTTAKAVMLPSDGVVGTLRNREVSRYGKRFLQALLKPA
jgi:hypothetical protein